MQVQKKRENTINAVNHDNDLQNGTQKQIKLWARLGNPWILPGRNNGSAEADPLIPEREEEYVGRGGHCMKGLSSDWYRCRWSWRLYIPASNVTERSRHDSPLLPSRMWFLTFLTCSVPVLEASRRPAAVATAGPRTDPPPQGRTRSNLTPPDK